MLARLATKRGQAWRASSDNNVLFTLTHYISLCRDLLDLIQLIRMTTEHCARW